MAQKSWHEKVEQGIADTVDEELEGEDFKEAVRENLEIGDIVKDLLENDDDLRAALKERLKQALLKKIVVKSKKGKGDEDDDDSEPATDEELFGDDFLGEIDVNDFFPGVGRKGVGNFQTMVKKLLAENEELANALEKRLTDALKELIEGDGQDPFDGIDLLDGVDMAEVSKKLLAQEATALILTAKLAELAGEKIQELNMDDLSEDFTEKMDLSGKVEQALADPQVQTQAQEIIQENVLDQVRRMTGDSRSPIMTAIAENATLQQIVTDVAEELLRDPKARQAIQKSAMENLKQSGNLGVMLLEKVAERLVGQVFKG